MADHRKILDFIGDSEDPEKLKQLRRNALEKGEQSIADAAFKRLVAISPSEEPGTVGYDLWRTIFAFEQVLTEEKGRTTRLSRTRQKIARVGEVQTLIDWACSDTRSDGFRMLLERDMPELTGEAIVLRHKDSFEPDVVQSAESVLTDAGVDISKVL